MALDDADATDGHRFNTRICRQSLLIAHGSLYVMLNLVQHFTASLYLSFSSDVSKKNRGLRCPRFSIRCMDERQLFFMMLATMRWYCCSSSSISCIFSNMSACSRQQSMTEISPSWQALTKVSMLVCIRAAS